MPETDVHKQPEAQTPTIEEANKSEQAMSETKNDVNALQQNVETTGQITGQTDALKFSVFLNLDLSKQEHFDQVTDMLLSKSRKIVIFGKEIFEKSDILLMQKTLLST